jgi:chromatin remodeling complex protein RSC6
MATNNIDITNITDDCPDSVTSQFDNILLTLSGLRQNITAVQNEIRTLEKTIKKEIKGYKKQTEKNKTKGNRKPSGFARPSKVTPELLSFMNKEAGESVARTEVTQYLISYIKDKKLQCEENKKIITPDDSLRSLLSCGDDEVNYFNLQKYMNKHFLKE